MGFFKSKRERLLEAYKELFKTVQIYGGVYGYMLRSGDTVGADRFKRAYDEWRQVSPLLIRGGTSREVASLMLDEYFNAAVTNKDIIEQNLTKELAKEEEQKLITATQAIREIIAAHP